MTNEQINRSVGCIICANGNDLPEGEYCRACGRKKQSHRRLDRAKAIREEQQCSVWEAVAFEKQEFEAAGERSAAPTYDWKDDPSADERWNAGCDFAMIQLCSVLGVDPKSVRWDAATETLDGDVSAVIGNILCAKLGEDWTSIRNVGTP